MSEDFVIGPLAEARENNELFADSILQQTILREVVAAIRACQLSPATDDLLDEAAKEQLNLLWTSIADEWHARGIDA